MLQENSDRITQPCHRNAEVIKELIKLAKQLSEADKRGVDLGLNDEEVAFYDALAANNSALEIIGKDNLKVIATELVT
jgi:type I restriction enzyme, R subunit